MKRQDKKDLNPVVEQGFELLQYVQKQAADWISGWAKFAQTTELPNTSWAQAVKTTANLGQGTLPQLDSVFGLEQKLSRLVQATASLAEASMQHQALIARTWMDTWQDYVGKSPEPNQSPRGYVNGWLEATNQALLQLHHSESFLAAQRQQLVALTDFRNQQRSVVELFQTQNHMPTNTEFDDLSHAVQDLRRELRALRREVATLRSESKPLEALA